MSKVHILKPEIISKIAAGEVIERPASVVKELVENAIDARSSSIEIELKAAGKNLISIKDNGQGIAEDDLKTIFQRHATSKIAAVDDLYTIQSLGFRGEALYSVAAVSHVSLRSKTESQETGMSIHLRGGEVFHVRPCPFNAHGTEITIKELFFNTPARKKFLKSGTTEIHQILSTVIPYVLLHHDIRFRLTHESKDLLNAAPAPSRKKRIADVLNLDERHLLEVQHDFPDKNIAVHLILGDINIKRSRRDIQYIFVNGRPVQNKAIGFHMNQIYRLIMPPELYPCFAVHITVPAAKVDVNIHPTKREVKIENEQDVCAILRAQCEQILMQTGQTKEAVTIQKLPGSRKDIIERALTGTHPAEDTFDRNVPADTRESSGQERDYAYPRGPGSEGQPEFFIPENTLLGQNQGNLQNKLRAARYIGRFINKFLLFETDRSLLVIDQHAAAERITYERLIRQMHKGSVEVQHLLSPVLVKLTPPEICVWEEAKEALESLGVSCSQWDGETVAVHAHPPFIKDVENALRHILGGGNAAPRDHDAVARRACRSSVMAGDKLSPEQAEHVRKELIACLDPFTCPHGRPTVIELTEDYLDKQFLRT